jgi:hypothetical protein
MVKEQHPPVPQRGLGPLQLTEVTGDICAAFVGERPRPRRKRKLEPPDAYGFDHGGDASTSRSDLITVSRASCPARRQACADGVNWSALAGIHVFAALDGTMEGKLS